MSTCHVFHFLLYLSTGHFASFYECQPTLSIACLSNLQPTGLYLHDSFFFFRVHAFLLNGTPVYNTGMNLKWVKGCLSTHKKRTSSSSSHLTLLQQVLLFLTLLKHSPRSLVLIFFSKTSAEKNSRAVLPRCRW